jgi:hypothetical protein
MVLGNFEAYNGRRKRRKCPKPWRFYYGPCSGWISRNDRAVSLGRTAITWYPVENLGNIDNMRREPDDMKRDE